MIALILILIAIFHSAELDQENKALNLGDDIVSNIMSGSTTPELIKLYYGKQPTLLPIEKISEELKQRIQTLHQNELSENKQTLLEMYRQSTNGKMISEYASNRISEIVRIGVQDDINKKFDGLYILDQDDLKYSKSEIALNDLLKALDHFGKYIFVPDSVECLRLNNLGLTSLWFKFGENSNIRNLHLLNNDFEEINQETFGKYFHVTAAQNLWVLDVGECTKLKEIDLNVMGPNIITLAARDCTLLNEIKNIPSSLASIFVRHTNIKKSSQLKFQTQNGNRLKNIECDAGACGRDFTEMLRGLYPNNEIVYHYISREDFAIIRVGERKQTTEFEECGDGSANEFEECEDLDCKLHLK